MCLSHHLSLLVFVSFEKLFEGFFGSIDLKPLGCYSTSFLVTGYH